MSAPFISRAVPLTELTVAAAAIGATYASIGSFSDPVELLMITSTLNEAIQISFDGTNDHIAVPAGSTVPVFIQVDFKSNNMVKAAGAVYVKEIVSPATGNLYVSAFSAILP